ncbi:MAG: hypothetical protein K9N46_08870 [Candidatus Marinimicrobia bacterium]|nr:hypothetical protein [Candidatus Neomarinimicrobiota bacterium]MCF7830219.1 hypothetical protein [Candidatus Neomarinimicrobiota bacterium]MCF7880836.1 hypothetical protein [Candidatus Neomarinimicrobiota bacterium]
MKRYGIKKWLPIVSGFVFLLLSMMGSRTLFAQARTHDMGDFKLRMEARDAINTNSVDPTGEWPQDYFRYGNIVFYYSGVTVGTWVDSLGEVHSKEQFLEGPVSYNRADPYGIKEYRRHLPPEVWVYSKGQMQLSSRKFNGTVDEDLPSDEMIEVHYKMMPGFDVVKRSYSYTNPNHDDYVIVNMKYKCTFDWDDDPDPDTDTDQTISDVYFLVGYSFQTAEGTYITYSRWYEEGKDDWATYESMPSTLVPDGRELMVSYGWDGDHPDINEFEAGGLEFDDTGDPRYAIGSGGGSPMPSGEFVSSAYSGFSALHVDNSVTDKTDNPAQPISIIGNISVYNVWDTDFTGFASIWDWASSGTRQTVEEQSGWPDDASAQEAEFPFQAFGPYDFNLGDSVEIAYVVGANGISRELAVEKGLEWRDWYRGESGATFDNNAKNELLATGKDSLFQTMDRAYWAFQRGYDIPDPLPTPDLTVESGPNVIYLEWQDMSGEGDPDTGVPDLDHYNIYRKRGAFTVDTYDELKSDGTHLVWRKVAEVSKDVNTYEDSDVVRGEPYHYAVTTVDDGTQNTDGLFAGQKLESSKYTNRSEIAAYAFEPGEPTADGVRIVPNPYITKAGDYNFTEAGDMVLFVNLPPYCTLRIFTVAGDLIKTINHVSGSADESWDLVTESNQLVASGVYILQVDDAKNIDEKPIPGSIEKFVVVR